MIENSTIEEVEVEETKKLEIAVSCLQHAVSDAQGTIRAYDQKANVMGVLLTVALGITNFTLLQVADGWAKGFLVGSWLSGLVSLTFLGLTLHPLRNPARNINRGGYFPAQTYFVGRHIGEHLRTVSEMAVDVLETDWVAELSFENTKLAFIRDHKSGMYKRAVAFSGVTMLFIALAVFCALGNR